jgi:N-methylhydantoinase B
LYRKEVIDSGGAGRYRGGLSAESCFIPHRTEVIIQDTLSSGNAIPTSPGMMGGYPATTNVYKFKRATDIATRLAARAMPADIAQVQGDDVTLQLRQENFLQQPADVYAVTWSAGGGFGDPLERDPEKVREDVFDNRSVSSTAAREIYGVVIASDGRLDAEATRLLRASRRDANRRTDGIVDQLHGKLVARVTDNLDLRREKDGLHMGCSKCAADLGPVHGNYKHHCVRRESDISTANPNIGDYRRYIDDRPVFRQFFCPGCGALIENEVARATDPVLWDIELRPRNRGKR